MDKFDGPERFEAAPEDEDALTQVLEALHVLVCEDNEGDFVLLQHHLKRITEREFVIDWVQTFDEVIEALSRNEHDVALVDYDLVGGSGLDVLREAAATDWQAPIIMLTGLEDPQIDLLAMKLGACDFLHKNELNTSVLERSIRYNIERKRVEIAASETNRELFRYIAKLRDAKHEIEMQNQRIVSLAYHLASACQGEPADRAAHGGDASAQPGIWNFDASGRTLDVNDVVLSILELKDAKALAQRSLDVLLSDDSRQRLAAELAALDPQAATTIEVELVGQITGQHNWVVMSLLSTSSDGDGPVYMATVVDITSRRNIEDANRYLATHDSLTGLANRTNFHETLRHATAIARRNGTLVGLLCIDLDGFKQVNDTYGHLAGDKVLREVAGRLEALARESDTVARLGGDEFAFIATNLHSREDAETVAEKIASVLAEPFELRGNEVHCGGSVGIAIFPDDKQDLEQLFEHADAALYRQKNSRGSRRQDSAVTVG